MIFIIKHFAKLSRINFDKSTTTIGQIYFEHFDFRRQKIMFLRKSCREKAKKGQMWYKSDALPRAWRCIASRGSSSASIHN